MNILPAGTQVQADPVETYGVASKNYVDVATIGHTTVDVGSGGPSVQIRAGLRAMFVYWTGFEENVSGHGYFQVQIATNATFTAIVYDVQVKGTWATFDGLNPDVNYFVRVRAVDASGVAGNWVSVSDTTEQAGTGDLADGAVTTVKITNLAVTNAKIDSMTASKVTTGTISGQLIVIAGGTAGRIQSDNFVAGSAGWRVRGNGDAEFNNITVRGQFYAGANGATIRIVNNDIRMYAPVGGTGGLFLDSNTQIWTNLSTIWVTLQSPGLDGNQSWIRLYSRADALSPREEIVYNANMHTFQGGTASFGRVELRGGSDLILESGIVDTPRVQLGVGNAIAYTSAYGGSIFMDLGLANMHFSSQDGSTANAMISRRGSNNAGAVKLLNDISAAGGVGVQIREGDDSDYERAVALEFLNSSEREFKAYPVTWGGALPRIRKMTAYRYERSTKRGASRRRDLGYMADELPREVVVAGKYVSLYGLVTMALQGIKELAGQVDRLEDALRTRGDDVS